MVEDITGKAKQQSQESLRLINGNMERYGIAYPEEARYYAKLLEKMQNTIDEKEAARVRERRARERRALVALLRREGFLKQGAESPAAITEASLAFLAAGRSAALVVGLEDLWGETQQQNTPGTGPRERPNWRHRARYSLEEIATMKTLAETLTRISEARKPGAKSRRYKGP